MQKASVKTLSIIDTLSELVQNEGEATRLATPYQQKRNNGSTSILRVAPMLKPRSPKVNVPSAGTPTKTSLSPANPQYLNSSPKKSPNPSKEGFNMSAISHTNGSQFPLKKLNGGFGAKKKKPTINGGGGGGRFPSNSRGQTPDWIRDIFLQAKRGIVDKLSSALEGLEPTLIRNLTDHLGNNLFHAVCSYGHVNLLPWLTRRFGNELNGALLHDENRHGLIAPIQAIKHGHLDCVQWLVRNTNLREWIHSQNGERSLLHYAAKYGKNEIVNWLSEEMVRGDISVNQVDVAGLTPMHLSAREGHLATLSALLHHGAQIDAKSDMSLSPYDFARISKKRDCAEFLLLFQSSLGLSQELLRIRSQVDALQSENNEIRSHFRDVLSISKKLAKERDEMCRELGRMYDSMMELHNNMTMEIQVLHQENGSLRKNGTHKNSDSELNSNNIEACTALHERWQQNQKTWFSNSLVDAEHRLMMTEESYKKIKGQNSLPKAQNSDSSYSHRLLRDRIEEIRTHFMQTNPNGPRLPSSSEEDDSDTLEMSDEDTSPEVMEMKRLRRSIAQRKKLATPIPKPNSSGSMDDSVYSSLSNDMYSKIGSPKTSQGMGSGEPLTPTETKRSREEIKTMIKNFNLTSESGTASVIEVIEPTSSEEEEFKKSMREMNISWSKAKMTSSPGRNKPELPSRRFSSGETSPTKRLLEMGVPVATLAEADMPEYVNEVSRKGTNDLEHLEEHMVDTTFDEDDDGDLDEKKDGKKTTFLQKIGIKTKWNKKRGPRKAPAGRESNGDEDDDEDEDGAKAEEHVLPDHFEEDQDDNQTASLKASKENILNRKSLSPQSRKSLYGSKTTMLTEATSVATSEDSGIGFFRPTSSGSNSKTNSLDNRNSSSSSSPNLNSKELNTPPVSGEFSSNRLGKIEEVSVTSSASRSSSALPTELMTQFSPDKARDRHFSSMISPLSLVRKKSLEAKAWYDVPSEDEREIVDEADSLASIISMRGSSDED
ncbi:hypothetical protein TCAL_04100 [Tigriopus californicus]|uniref:Uncharacterized protein n=1 Tax=Tigriopus californicus TaxID=6832 RepID=A0A553NSJ9_TIGCA|nr:uncharacterized protein LOC131893572 [Tigriopus californicus]XP_059099626.1 uncharacterized protein LOC131893572 [Tigriopus californicus]XP_059099634.1 uncharacterized protein LOC131893572 [Tigriopus californicus]TRY68412.1 hypothetical protein TCAL_04100 [Tigriopus californicus]